MADTVILGAGIIGLSTAYYLSESPRSVATHIHVVDPSPELFHCASGLAGGFLAKDWFAPSVAPLGELSFRLHRELAEKNNGREEWGYSKSIGTSLDSGSDESAGGGAGEDWLRDGTSRAEAVTSASGDTAEDGGPAWLNRSKSSSLDVIASGDSVAQVDPKRLCQFLLKRCLERGIKLHNPAKALSISKDTRDCLASIRIASQDGTETDIPCTRVIIAAGAWTPKVFSTLFPSSPRGIPISPLAGHSLVIKSPRWKKDQAMDGCHAVFASDMQGFSPEIFGRLEEEIYIAGLNSSAIPLPSLPTDAKPDDKEVEKLRIVATQLLGSCDSPSDIEITRTGLCFRPVTSNGRPIVSRIPDSWLGPEIVTRGGGEGGVFVAAGHGPWGISQSLGTGKVLSELLEGRRTSANVSALALL